MAVPEKAETIRDVPVVDFGSRSFEDCLENPLFPDGRGADVVHAWTPREVVRKFVLLYRKIVPGARLVVHLEDHEDCLVQTYSGKSPADFGLRRLDSYNPSIPPALAHPFRAARLLRISDGITLILEALRVCAPVDLPSEIVPPPFDPLYRIDGDFSGVKASLGFASEDAMIAYTGNTTFANIGDLRELYDAVWKLRKDGVPFVFVKTGYQMYELKDHPLCADAAGYRDLGFVEKELLPRLVAASSVLVQPGKPGVFNEFRLPSKLPEFLASGRPVVTLRANIGLQLRDGHDAFLFESGDSAELAVIIRKVLSEKDQADRVGANGRIFAETMFSTERSVDALEAVYTAASGRPMHPAWAVIGQRPEATELTTWLMDADEPFDERESVAELFEASLEAVSAEAIELGAENAELAHAKGTLEHEIAAVRYAKDTREHELRVLAHETSVERNAREAELSRVTHELLARDNECLILKRRIASMEQSASWKLTGPLRSAVNAVRPGAKKEGS